MDEFQKGEIDKSAAVTLASMPEEDQDQALSQGRKTDKELKAYKKEVLEPTSNEILTAYDELDIREIDCPDRKETCKKLIERYGKSHLGQTSDTINISCTPKTITIINGLSSFSDMHKNGLSNTNFYLFFRLTTIYFFKKHVHIRLLYIFLHIF